MIVSLLWLSVLFAAATADENLAKLLTPKQVVDILVRDILAVERGETPLLSFENSPQQLSQRIIKDRYDWLYQHYAQKSGSTHHNRFPAPKIEEDSLYLFSEYSNWLTASRDHGFVSTEVGIKGFNPGPEFIEQSQQLRSLLDKFQTKAAPPPPPNYSIEELVEYANSPLPEKISLSRVRLLERLFNTSYLPSHAEVSEVFPWLSPRGRTSNVLTVASVLQPLSPDLTKVFSSCLFEIEDYKMLQQQDLLTPLNWIYFYSNPYFKVCEMLTIEYLGALGRYVGQRIKDLIADPKYETKKVVILELGAGNGRLPHFLSKSIIEIAPFLAGRFTIVATDIAGNVGDVTQKFPVVQKDYKAALMQSKPAIVIVSWMSKDVDWTHDIRAKNTVEEYILIGEKDYGASGLPKETWGVSKDEEIPSWKRDGFQRYDLERAGVLQIARTDSPYVRFHSKTVAFRRTSPRSKYNLDL